MYIYTLNILSKFVWNRVEWLYLSVIYWFSTRTICRLQVTKFHKSEKYKVREIEKYESFQQKSSVSSEVRPIQKYESSKYENSISSISKFKQILRL